MAQTPPQIFNSTIWQQNRDRAARTGFAQAAFLKELACTRLAERLELVKRDFTDILDLGCHSGQMGAALPSRFHQQPMHLTQTDASALFVQQAASANPFAQASLVMTDELLPVEQASCDAVLSSLYLHWMNDLPGMLTQIRLALRPDGLFLAVLLGGRSLTELRGCLAEAETELYGGLSPRVTPMADIRDLGSL
ncbi:MAG TPA: SAM-dependent methyltransferase, partial [Alphaproteobacteria bacterium]|nr:SAM-dependent methyltransferase [Alphaproteobacteria bacterium]